MTNSRVRELAHSHRKRLAQSPRGHDYGAQGDASALYLTQFSLLYPPYALPLHQPALCCPVFYLLRVLCPSK